MNELAIPGANELIKHDDNDFKMVMAATQAYLPRVQLGGGSSMLVKEGKLPMGHYGLIVGDTVTDLGATFDCLVTTWQWKAMDTSVDPPISETNKDAPVFVQIRDKSEIKDSGCMWGPEFLIYLPEQDQFASFFMASKTARRESPQLHALVGRTATLQAKFIKKPKYSWHGPVVTPCAAVFDIPTQEAIAAAVKKFQIITTAGVEVVDEAASDRAR